MITTENNICELMISRGYEKYNGMYWWWYKYTGIYNDILIFLKVDITQNHCPIQLSSNPMKMLISLNTEYFQIDHPNFINYENKLINYIDACIQYDETNEAIKERIINRKK